MTSSIEIIYNSLFHLPHLLFVFGVIISVYLISYHRIRQKICATIHYQYLPFSFLYIGVLGAFWDIMFGFIEIDSITEEFIIGTKNQIESLKHAVGLLVSGIALFLSFKLFIDKGTGCPHSSWKK